MLSSLGDSLLGPVGFMQVVLFVTQHHDTPHIWLKILFKYSYKSERVQLEDVPIKEISLAYIVNHSITQLHTGLSLVWGGEGNGCNPFTFTWNISLSRASTFAWNSQKLHPWLKLQGNPWWCSNYTKGARQGDVLDCNTISFVPKYQSEEKIL